MNGPPLLRLSMDILVHRPTIHPEETNRYVDFKGIISIKSIFYTGYKATAELFVGPALTV